MSHLLIDIAALVAFGMSTAFALVVCGECVVRPHFNGKGAMVAAACGFILAAGAAKVFFR